MIFRVFGWEILIRGAYAPPRFGGSLHGALPCHPSAQGDADPFPARAPETTRGGACAPLHISGVPPLFCMVVMFPAGSYPKAWTPATVPVRVFSITRVSWEGGIFRVRFFFLIFPRTSTYECRRTEKTQRNFMSHTLTRNAAGSDPALTATRRHEATRDVLFNSDHQAGSTAVSRSAYGVKAAGRLFPYDYCIRRAAHA